MSDDTKDMVTFLMPDGTKVSNDPRFDMEEALEAQLASHENRGDVGITAEEQKAQTQVESLANMQSGQPGVGENPAPDPHDLIPNTGTPAMRIQKEDRQEAEEAGADLTSTSVQDAEPVDSNEAVKEARKAAKERADALAKAQAAVAEGEAGDPDKPYSEWSSKQLKLEVARRNAEEGRADENMLDMTGLTKKSQVADLLDNDNARNQG